MPDFGIFRGFNDKLFGNKLYAGQLPTQLGKIGSESFGLLLDIYPNAAAAYSLRKLRSAYTGSAIRVRRSSDNTEQDIGFSAGNLDSSALTSFCGSGNGFVTTWYDQSGNSRNATQTTAANQPQIVSSGNVILQNDKPNIYFNNKSLAFSRLQNIEGLFAVAYTAKITTDPTSILIRDNISEDLRGLNMLISPNTWTMQQIGSSRTSSYKLSPNSLSLFYIMTNGTNAQYALNGNADSLFSETDKISSNIIGNYHIADYNLNGGVQELIFYPSDQSSNRTGIETNINLFYLIY